MVSAVPDAAAAPERAVDRAGETDGEPTYATRERPAILGLRDEMDVVVLDAYSTLRTAPRCASSATLGIP